MGSVTVDDPSLAYCLSDRAKRQDLPCRPERCTLTKLSFPRSFAASPGVKLPLESISKISWISASLRSLRISSRSSEKEYAIPRRSSRSPHWNFSLTVTPSKWQIPLTRLHSASASEFLQKPK